MAKRAKAAPELIGLGGRGKAKGLARATFYILPAQLDALRQEAAHRMAQRKASRSDASEVVREAIQGWMDRRR